MLAQANNTSVNNATETTICSWTADGVKQFVGFHVSIPKGGQARLYIGGTRKITVDLPYTGEMPAFEWIDKPIVYSANTLIELKVYQETGAAQTVSGSLLGG